MRDKYKRLAGAQMESSFVILKDLSGTSLYPDNALPLYTKEGDLTHEGSVNVTHHWHEDLEFIYVRSGTAKVYVNNRDVTLVSGQGLFLNSRSLHYLCTAGESSAVLVRIHPDIFNNGLKPCSEYFSRKFGRGEPSYIVFDCSESWHFEVLNLITELRACDLNIADHPLSVLVCVFRLIELIGDHLETSDFSEKDDQDYSIFLGMIKYLHDNYSKKVNIDVMADDLNISRTRAYRLFERFAHTSPNSYLNFYRLIISQQMLRGTDLSIYEIASRCGFQTSSYYTKIFGKELGVSPKVYREQSKGANC